MTLGNDVDRRIRQMFESANQAFAGGQAQAAERMLPPKPLSGVCAVATPVSGSTLRFCSLSLRMRSRSVVGSKSTPNRPPESAVENGDPTATAAPVMALMR